MQVYKIYPEGFAANSYLLTADGVHAVAVDPAQPRIVREAQARSLTVTHVLLTHGHFDHTGGCAALQAAGAKVGSLAAEVPLIGGSGNLAAMFGAPMSASLIYMTCGAAASLTITLNALCETGDEFIVISPYFPEYRVFIEQAGGTVVEVPADENFHLDVAVIGGAITPHTKAIVLNSPNNPTGAVYTREELAALAAMLEQKNAGRTSKIVLIADEPYRELTYGAQVPYLMALYPHTVVCYSFSKSLSLAGERIGYIAVSPQCENAEALFAAVCGAGRAQGYVCAPSLFQRVTAKCLGQSGDIAAYRENRDLLYNALVQDGFTCIPPEGAFYLFMKSPEPDAKAFCERAKKYELLLVPSDSFGVEGYVRISYCVAKETIQNSLPAFRLLAEEYRL